MDDAMSSRDARIVALTAHACQFDKLGEPYFHHVERVAMSIYPEPRTGVNVMDWTTNDRLQVAYLHDVVEDTPVTLQTLSAIGFTRRVIKGGRCDHA